jgi:hypothetical protein
MFANGTVGQGGPYDGIVTLNSSVPYQFTRPTSAGHLDAQRSTEHEVDEVIGLGSRLGHTGRSSSAGLVQLVIGWCQKSYFQRHTLFLYQWRLH